MQIRHKILTSHVPPFKVTQSHWKLYGSIGHLWLPISVPYWTISYRSQDEWQYLQNFPIPYILSSRWQGSPWNFVTAVGHRKPALMPLPECEKCDDIPIRSVTLYRHWTDWQTDRQTELVKQYRAVQCIGMLTRDNEWFECSINQSINQSTFIDITTVHS